jgi:hypothetical protein
MSAQAQPEPAAAVFISYSHESAEHEDKVLALAHKLRSDGINAVIDQYVAVPANGWPRWTEQEIRNAAFVLVICTESYLQRVNGQQEQGKGRGVVWEANIIYNLLYNTGVTTSKFIPVLFDPVHSSFIPTPLQGMPHYVVTIDEGYDGLVRHIRNEPRVAMPALGTPAPRRAPRSYPASLNLLATQSAPARRNRSRMIARVRNDWIRGVLEHSLYKVARLELGLNSRPEAVERPLDLVIDRLDDKPEPLPPGTSLRQVFDDSGQALLILGGPGAGKTTLLLELARDLLDRAETDESFPVPVVFNLSSWALRRTPLRDWLIDELNERSDVPRPLGTEWVDGEQILPLLDGLDEVNITYRAGCVEAINTFRRAHGLLPIAVCSRLLDYEATGAALRLSAAVVVQPLPREYVESFLKTAGPALAGLRRAAHAAPQLFELFDTPLLLSIGMMAYESGAELEAAETADVDELRRVMFTRYVDAMFRRRARDKRYSREQTVWWLSQLAKSMQRQKQTMFYVESVGPDWLTSKWRRALFPVLTGLLTCVLALSLFAVFLRAVSFGMDDWLFSAWDIFLLLGGFMVIVGLITTAAATLVALWAPRWVKPVERIHFTWSGVRDAAGRKLLLALAHGLFFCIAFGSAYFLWALGLAWLFNEASLDAEAAVLFIALGFAAGVLFGLFRALTSVGVPVRARPNSGLRMSLRNASVFGAVGLFCFGAACGVAVSVLETGNQLENLLSGGVFFGPPIGLALALINGGLFCIQHLAARLLLWNSGQAPFRYVRFLEFAVERVLLRRVGGGYIFLHRMFAEFFAESSSRVQAPPRVSTNRISSPSAPLPT